MNLKKTAAVILAFAWLAAGCGQRVLVQPTADMTQYRRIAILPFETDSFLSNIGYQLADEIMVQVLDQAPELEIVERTRIDNLIQEQHLARNGYLNPETAVSVGRLLGVQAIVVGSVTVSVGDISPTTLNPQRVATGSATMRFIDVETGKILWAKRKSSEYAMFKSVVDGQVSYALMTDHEMIQRVIRDMGQQLAQAFYPHYEMR